MEQLEILSKSYLVRWVQVSEGHTISWTIQPHKKSLNFGLFKHPGGSGTPAPSPSLVPPGSSYVSHQVADPSTPTTENHNSSQPLPSPRRPRSSSNAQTPNNRDHITASTAQQKLESLGLRTVVAPYKCPADVVTVGTWDVKGGHGGNYALVFDNTFSKQVSKTATFVLLTYLTEAPPTSGIRQPGASGSAMSLALATAQGKSDGMLGAVPSFESVSMGSSPPQAVTMVPYEARRPRSHRGADKAVAIDTNVGKVFAGVMHKRRRKHHSYAKRFFSLDSSSGTLSYYKNRHSSALRGAIPLSLAVVSVNDRTREISVDSGAEIWHLRVGGQKEFDAWKEALEKVSSAAAAASAAVPVTNLAKGIGTAASMAAATVAAAKMNAVAGEQEWLQVEALVGRVAGIRDAVRRLAKDTDPKYLMLPPPTGMRSSGVSPVRAPSEIRTPSEASFELGSKDDDKGGEPRRPFWKRKASGNSNQGSAASSSFFKRSVSAQHVPTVGGIGSASLSGRFGKQQSYLLDDDMHEHCIQIMHDLDQVVANFTTLLSNSKQRRRPQSTIHLSHRTSQGSMSSDEQFFDAHDGESALSHSQLLEIRRDSGEYDDQEFASIIDDADSSGEDDVLSPAGDSLSNFRRRRTTDEESSLFPRKPKTLAPLPISTAVVRRRTVPSPKVPPPSLIAFFRKNVGKDLSTIAMPVSANEPVSALQRLAEQLEYSSLLDSAAAEADPTMRVLLVAAFAISSFSSNRAKERAIRKPFNPMLGETFELVREDRGFRLLAEKICHRPVRMALQAESFTNGGWTFFQCATPTQKFWGKSAELNTEGRARIVFHELSEVYGYELATSFLRNVIAGEKYVEPVSTMTVSCESTGVKAVVTFRAGGMFAGRSEEVSVQCFDSRGLVTEEGLAGKWTTGLGVTRSGADDGRQIWKVGNLVENAAARYGFTVFAAQMNEITELEKGKMSSTDSRLRPDQRALEVGNVDEAETLKAKLEESQRTRRKIMEEKGEEWKPRWFMTTGTDGDEAVWKMKGGRDGYWEAREKSNWTGLTNVFEY